MVPVFNEAATIADIVERARLHGPVLVVDDGSTDGTAARAAAAGAEVIALGARRGKGAALRCGFAEARGAARPAWSPSTATASTSRTRSRGCSRSRSRSPTPS